ncbi:sorbitol dehydrogenase [Gluconobacter thailandicus]|uniref:c-type cytochrome n=1 Tax=Gluconobacter thailandicus TaxID=257438 RepID=UPI00077794FE|nr:cytochrome c [Gluconobacter thailandicus]KXV34809.1 sorbitol dehydrogenase [Gluconobacter thailandicus]
MHEGNKAGIRRLFLSAAVASGVLFGAQSARAEDQATTISRGAYLATAGDCVACHTKPGGAPFAGGLVIASPMGGIVASNITPDPDTGIGKYTEEEFANALRKGIRRDGAHLYPAMPYTAYSEIADTDIHALYVYFMHGVAPLRQDNPKTELKFPFNIRAMMISWNLLFAGPPAAKGDPQTYSKIERGHYLADALGHCGTCHTPRNFLMGERSSSAYLGGTPLAGWYAPNITPSMNSGIGDWSEDDLVQYLRTGSVPGRAQAAGMMGEAVEHSFSKLTDEDLHAIAAYIRQIPKIEDSQAKQPRDRFGVAAQPIVDLQKPKLDREDDLFPMDGERIYVNNCAACHGLDGAGAADHFTPSLSSNAVVGAPGADNLIMAIVNGVDRTTNGHHVLMPGFGPTSDVQRLSDTDVAKLTNYVSGTFGSGDHHVTAQDVKVAREGGPLPALVKDMPALIGAGVIAAFAAMSGLIWWFRRRTQKQK